MKRSWMIVLLAVVCLGGTYVSFGSTREIAYLPDPVAHEVVNR